MGRFVDLTGQRFGRLTVIERAEDYVRPNGHSLVQWHCICDCGNEQISAGYSLTHGRCTSCGCARTERLVKMNTTHGDSNSVLFRRYEHMKERCNNPTCKSYKHYGGRGIKVCDEWMKSFEAFRDWSLANGFQENLTIDRIDVNGNYEPNNCRWADTEIQCNNRRNNLYIRLIGETKTLKQWCDIYDLNYKTAHAKYRYKNYSFEDILKENGVTL